MKACESQTVEGWMMRGPGGAALQGSRVHAYRLACYWLLLDLERPDLAKSFRSDGFLRTRQNLHDGDKVHILHLNAHGGVHGPAMWVGWETYDLDTYRRLLEGGAEVDE